MRLRRPWLFAGVAGLALAGALFLYSVRAVLAPFLAALALAYLLAPLVSWCRRRGLPATAAILLIYAVLGLFVTAFVLLVLPALMQELARLLESLPKYAAALREWLAAAARRYQAAQIPSGLRLALDRFIAETEARSAHHIQAALSGTLGLPRALISLALAPFLAFYILRDMDEIHRVLVRAVPRRWRGEALQVCGEARRVVAGYVQGQLLLALCVGAMAALACYLLGLRYAVLLGAIAAVAELIPFLGPVLGAVPAVAAALTISPLTAAQVAIAFAIIQQVESAILSPLVMGESVGLHPVAVFFAVLAGGALLGAWGLVLAVPVAGVLRVLLHHVSRKLAP